MIGSSETATGTRFFDAVVNHDGELLAPAPALAPLAGWIEPAVAPSAADYRIAPTVHKSMHLDADAAWVAVALREAKQQPPPECARCLLRATLVRRASGRPAAAAHY